MHLTPVITRDPGLTDKALASPLASQPAHPAPFSALPAGKKYGLIYADPPWRFRNFSAKGEGKNAVRHYECMPLAEIKALPVVQLAASNAILLLWVTDPFLEHAFEVIRAWGFRYKTVGFYWTKTNADGSPFMGPGYWTRANPEQCLLATRGAPRRVGRDVSRWITSPRREHSRKPDEAYERIERLATGPYLELFARRPAGESWDVWGNQTSRFAAGAS